MNNLPIKSNTGVNFLVTAEELRTLFQLYPEYFFDQSEKPEIEDDVIYSFSTGTQKKYMQNYSCSGKKIKHLINKFLKERNDKGKEKKIIKEAIEDIEVREKYGRKKIIEAAIKNEKLKGSKISKPKFAVEMDFGKEPSTFFESTPIEKSGRIKSKDWFEPKYYLTEEDLLKNNPVKSLGFSLIRNPNMPDDSCFLINDEELRKQIKRKMQEGINSGASKIHNKIVADSMLRKYQEIIAVDKKAFTSSKSLDGKNVEIKKENRTQAKVADLINAFRRSGNINLLRVYGGKHLAHLQKLRERLLAEEKEKITEERIIKAIQDRIDDPVLINSRGRRSEEIKASKKAEPIRGEKIASIGITGSPECIDIFSGTTKLEVVVNGKKITYIKAKKQTT